MRAVFFGTPEFAVPSLSRLLEAGIEIPLVVTQPDRPVGRHSTPLPSAVARLAALRAISTVKPQRLRGDSDLLDQLARAAPDVGVVVAYGGILPPEILAVPPLGFVNVHASLLPKYRGASPIQAAILAGDSESGVSTMRVEQALDAGPVYLQRRAEIGPRENAGSLSRRLSEVGSDLLVETLRGLGDGTLAAQPQPGIPSFSRPIRRADAAVDWTLRAEEIDRRLRAFTPWPGLHGFLEGRRVKILAAEPGPPVAELPPGTVTASDDRTLVAAGAGTSLVLETVQMAGRRPVSGAKFLRGFSGRSVRFEPLPPSAPE